MIISTAILLLVLLPVFVSVILSTPYVQNRLIDYASRYASRYLDTEVSIGRIDVTTMGGVQTNDLLIRDLQGDSLIYVKQLNTRLLSFSPWDKTLSYGQSKLHGGLLHIKEVDKGLTNISQLVALINKRRAQQKMVIKISGAQAEDLMVVIEQLQHRNVSYGVDYGYIRLNNLSARADQLRIEGDNVTAEIEKLSFVEASGFRLEDLTAKMQISNGVVQLDDLVLYTQQSALKVRKLRLSDEHWLQYRNFINSTAMYIDVKSGYISSDDVAYFSPTLRSWGVTFKDINMSASGRVDNLNLDIRNISYGSSTHLAAQVELEGLPLIDSTHIKASITELVSVAPEIEELSHAITGKRFTAESSEIISAVEDISLRGSIEGALGDVTANLHSESALGAIATNMQVEWQNGGETTTPLKLKGSVNLGNVQLQKLAGSESGLGATTLSANISSVIDPESTSEINVVSSVSYIEWNNYKYQNIDVAGRLGSNSLRATVGCADPNLMFGLTAAIEDVNMMGSREGAVFNANTSSAISLNLMYANLEALGVSRTDGGSTLATDITLNAKGDDMERLSGDVMIRHLNYTLSDNVVKTDSMSLNIESQIGQRSMRFDSDFATMTFESSDSITNIIEYLSSALESYLPALYDSQSQVEELPTFSSALAMGAEQSIDTLANTQRTKRSNPRKKTTQNISTFELQVKDASPVLAILGDDLQVNEGSSLKFNFDTQSRRFNGEFRSEYIEQSSMLAIGIAVDVSNDDDSVVLRGAAKDLFIGTLMMNNTQLSAVASNDKITMKAGFSNDEDESLAELSADMRISRRRVNGQSIQELDIELHPSVIHDQEQKVWNLSANAIRIKYAGIEVDRFSAANDDQHMLIHGLASRSAADTINMSMRNFDLSILTTFISRVGYQLEGVTNGHINVASALDNARVEADIKLDSVSVNTIPAPPMELGAIWDSQMNRARLTLVNRNNREMILRGYYIPTEMSYYANLLVNNADMSLLDPPLKGITCNTMGDVDIDLILQGEGRNAMIEGAIDLRDASTTIAYTQVTYNIPAAKLSVKNNLISAQNIVVNDGGKGTGRLSINVDMQNLSNIKYSLTVAPDNLLVLKTNERDNDVFYGTLYASGLANIKGDRGGSKMDIAAISEGDSHFFMQLLSKSSISTADFIKFVEPEKEQITDIAVLRRMQYKSSLEAVSNALEINMSLDVRPNTEVQLVIDPTMGDIIKARGAGRFNLSINPSQNLFEMYGDYSISEGSYLFTLSNIINKRFVIEPNSMIQWTGSPTNAMLNIDAIYQLKTSLQPLISTESTRAVPVNCVIRLSDMLTRPDVSFAIDFPSLDSEQQAVVSTMLNDQEVISRQFFYLMLANSFIPESSGIDSELGLSTTAATGFELLTNQLSNWLSTSNYNIIIRYRPESELTGEEVDIGFSRGLINNRLLLEVEGNYISDGEDLINENVSNFTGEAYLTWLIDQAGALQLRGFTQTIDRFDENQGLQETGIGITYREDFENFADLRAKVKERFSASPERQQRRQARRDGRKEEDEELN